MKKTRMMRTPDDFYYEIDILSKERGKTKTDILSDIVPLLKEKKKEIDFYSFIWGKR